MLLHIPGDNSFLPINTLCSSMPRASKGSFTQLRQRQLYSTTTLPSIRYLDSKNSREESACRTRSNVAVLGEFFKTLTASWCSTLSKGFPFAHIMRSPIWTMLAAGPYCWRKGHHKKRGHQTKEWKARSAAQLSMILRAVVLRAFVNRPLLAHFKQGTTGQLAWLQVALC